MALTQVNSLGIKDLEVKTADIAADAVTGAKIADDQIDSEHYVDGSIDTAHIADDAVTLAKLASGTDGQIISWDASGNPVAIGPGSDGQVLTSTGSGSPPAFEAASGGATINNATANELVTVASTTTQLDAEANLTFDGTSLVLTGDQMIQANDAAAKLKFRSNNTASDDEELGSVTWQSSANNVNASIAGHRATWTNDGYLVFKTASSGTLSEQLRIDRFGNLDVARGNIEIKTDQKGLYSTAGKINVHATSGQITLKTDSNDVIMAQATDNSNYTNSILQSYGARNTTNGTWNLAHFYGPGFGGQFKVADSGNCTNTNNSYGSTSDERLKQDIVDAASQWNDIKGLRVRKFRWKAAPTAPLSIGLVAQEAEKVSPGLVENTGVEEQDEKTGHAKPKFDADGNRETVKTLKYSVLYMKAIKCLQEAQARIETLETKVAALEAG